jgi:hypothetical protein
MIADLYREGDHTGIDLGCDLGLVARYHRCGRAELWFTQELPKRQGADTDGGCQGGGNPEHAAQQSEF